MSKILSHLTDRKRAVFCALFAFASALTLSTETYSDQREYVLATASPGGTYHPVGVALATLIKAELKLKHGVSMVAVPTAGSAENVRLLHRGEADFAIMQALVGYDAWNGARTYASQGPRRGFRAITALWRNVEQFVVRAELAKTGTIADLLALKGKRISLGEKNSGTLLSNRTLLGNLGVDIDRDYQLAYLGYGPAADALQAGDIAAIGIPAGLPTKALSRAKSAAGDAITILSLTAEQARAADGGLGLWLPFTISANTYPAQTEPIRTIAQPNLLVVRSDIDADAVYLITKTIFKRSQFLQRMHEATREIALESALVSLPVPLHSGAVRYFKQAGLQVPKHLIE